MIILHLSRGNSSLRVPLRLPAKAAEAREAFAALDKILTNRPTVIKEVTSPIRNLEQYVHRANLDMGDDFVMLNRLAKKIGDMSEKERILFSGALDASSINGLNDVLYLTEQMNEFVLLPEITNDTELGRFIAVSAQLHNDPRFPEAALPYLDFAKIGAEYYADHGGAYTAQGYVLRKRENTLAQAEPTPDESRPGLISMTLKNSRKEFLLLLPACEDYLDEVARYMGVEDFAELSIEDVQYKTPYLSDLIPVDCINVEDANELAERLEGITEQNGELLTYAAALAAEVSEDFTQALRIAENIDDYERVPEDAEEYGKDVLRRIGADDEMLDMLDGYADFEALGNDFMDNDGVRKTEFGSVRRISEPFECPSQGMDMKY